jgi:predicted RNase H-like nuclease (RuvC/YqgF family)
MIFKKSKKKDMVDLRELQKRGVVRIPKKQIKIPTTSEGFVEVGKTEKTKESQSNANFFGFMDTPSEQSKSNHEQSTSSVNDKQLRAQDSRITDLDNKIYKLEQRIELLEKKLDVNQSTNKVGPMGW